MSLDKTIFKIVNGFSVPPVFDELFVYAHGLANVEIAFFLFCIILFLIVVGAPKRGPRAAIAVFIATMITYFGAGNLRKLLVRPYPVLDENLGAILRVEVLRASSAFPVLSIVMFSTIAMSIVFYFPKYTLGLMILSVFYASMPIYLGIAYPSDAFGSLLLGAALGYTLMQILSRTQYFSRYQ